MRRLLALASIFLLGVSAAITPLIELSKDDSTRAQTLHATLTQLQTDYSGLERQMYRGYVKDSNTQGFPAPLYSADFHFLVGIGDPAPILELSADDTAKLQAAYNALLQAQQDIEAFHHHILETYIAIRGSEKAAVSFGDPPVMVPAERAAFQHFRYTQDYRFILPR
ncbi:MAG TPA: hypothetical protein VHW09_09135 [Bryobacteraceae bacterium]|jgi:hypothetical protein|nr:hypothetical protein [Bryobacteraceae bacterium]